jgi:hypothetical protein
VVRSGVPCSTRTARPYAFSWLLLIVALTTAFQPQRLMIALAVVGCKRLFGGQSGAFSMTDAELLLSLTSEAERFGIAIPPAFGTSHGETHFCLPEGPLPS